jgi:hypothetical protein
VEAAVGAVVVAEAAVVVAEAAAGGCGGGVGAERASETELASGCLATAVCLTFFEQPTARNAPRSKSRPIRRLVDMGRSLWRSAEVRQGHVHRGRRARRRLRLRSRPQTSRTSRRWFCGATALAQGVGAYT